MQLRELPHAPLEPALHRLQNDSLELTFLPAAGGRLLSLRSAGREWLWRNPELISRDFRTVLDHALWPTGTGGLGSWANIGGSKTWPAPQGWDGDGQWAGPPDLVLDAGEYALAVEEADDSTTVTLTSAPDARSGLQIERRFTVPTGGSAFTQTNTFTNVSQRTIRWSIWEVAQVDCSDAIDSDRGTVEVGGTSTAVTDLGTHRGQPALRHDGERTVIPVQDVVAKRGFPGADGSIAYRAPDGKRLALTFTADPAATYPDDGSRAELWMQAPQPGPMEDLQGLHPTAWLVELEVLSPLITLEPGQSATRTIGWSISA